MTRKYLITGGAGFIGSNFIRYVLKQESDAQVTNLDALTYAGVKATVDELDEIPRHTFVEGIITDANLVHDLIPGHDVVVHFAAESHVDRSISGPAPFLETNFVKPISSTKLDRPAHRPANSVLDSERLAELGVEPLPKYGLSLGAAVAVMVD